MVAQYKIDSIFFFFCMCVCIWFVFYDFCLFCFCVAVVLQIKRIQSCIGEGGNLRGIDSKGNMPKIYCMRIKKHINRRKNISHFYFLLLKPSAKLWGVLVNIFVLFIFLNFCLSSFCHLDNDSLSDVKTEEIFFPFCKLFFTLLFLLFAVQICVVSQGPICQLFASFLQSLESYLESP